MLLLLARVLSSVVLSSTHAFASPVTGELSLHTDECEFIREGVRSLRARGLRGGEFRIPSGTYTCTKPIVLDQSHTTLRGDQSVFLKLADGANAPVIVMGDANTPPAALEDITVQSVSIDGNRLHQTMECWGGPCDSGGTAFVRNNGISVRGLTRGKILNVVVTGARSGGVVTERGCFDLQVDHLTATDNHFDGFAGYETTRAVLSNLILSNNQAAGISIDIDFHGNTFRDVFMDNNGDVGVFMRDSNHNRFENMTIHNSGNHGLFLAQVENVDTCPVDNEFLNLTVTGSRGWGFRLNDACQGNRLTGLAHFAKNRDGCIGLGTSVGLDIQGTLQCEQ